MQLFSQAMVFREATSRGGSASTAETTFKTIDALQQRQAGQFAFLGGLSALSSLHIGICMGDFRQGIVC